MAQFTQADLTYIGGFKTPAADDYAYAQGPIAYNPANDSLYMCGHTNNQKVGEIGIPTIVNASSLSQYQQATIIQALVNPLEGHLDEIKVGTTNNVIGGLLIANGLLYISAYNAYDASASQTSTHFSRPLNLLTTGSVIGPANVGIGLGATSGYMCSIPAAHQAALGGEYLTGNSSLSIISRSSYGPSCHVFDPADVLGTDHLNPVQVAAVNLLQYPSSHTTLGDGTGDGTGPWNYGASNSLKSILFPPGYDSVLFFGSCGIGPHCYGDPVPCGDLCGGSKGNHDYPYVHRAWCYDVADLAAVKAGSMNFWEPIPVYWDFGLPFTTCQHKIGGMAHDITGGRVFLVQSFSAGNGRPVIHVFEIAGEPPVDVTTVTRSAASIGAGHSQTVTWGSIANPNTNDWVGLFEPGALEAQRIEWFYLNASKTAPVSAVGASGNFSFPLPGRLRSGTYEFRLFAQEEVLDEFDNPVLQNSLMATSATFSVQGKKVRVR